MANQKQQGQSKDYPSESRLELIKEICERLFAPDVDELDLESWGFDDD